MRGLDSFSATPNELAKESAKLLSSKAVPCVSRHGIAGAGAREPRLSCRKFDGPKDRPDRHTLPAPRTFTSVGQKSLERPCLIVVP